MMNPYVQLIDREIFTLKANIDRLKGVGCYQDHCWRWKEHVLAYEKLRDLMLADAPNSFDV